MSQKSLINCLKFSSVALCLLFLQPALAQGNKKNVKELGLTEFPDFEASVMRNSKAWGNDLVATIWTDTLVYKHELGQFDSKTLAPLGACSQWLVTALALKLAEQGKISLDDKVSQYLPIYETYGKSYITLRHCLTHFTGIQNEGGLFGKKKYGSLEDEVTSYAKQEIKTNPGTEFSYSNIGPNIVGRILEIVMKKKFDMLIKQQLFTPLGMRKSSFSNLDGSSVNPATGGQSSAEEFMHFLKMLLNNGNYNGLQYLSEESVKELRTIQTRPELVKFVPKTTEGFSYALGSWAVEEGKEGQASALSGEGLTGTWAVVDWCRGYAALILVKEPQGEQKKLVYVEAKGAIDDKLNKSCQ